MRQTSTAQYVTQPANGVWTQVESTTLHLKQYPELDSHLYILLILRDQNQLVNVSSFYQSINLRLKALAQGFTPEKKDGFNTSLKTLIQEVLADTPDLTVEVVVAFQFGADLFVGGTGGTTVTLVRGGEVGKILDTSQGVTLVTGSIYSGDILLLASSRFYSLMPYTQLKQTLTNRYAPLSVDTVTSELVVTLSKKEANEGVGFIFGQYAASEEVPESTKTTKSWIGRLQTKLPSRKTTAKEASKVYLKRHNRDSKRQRLSILLTLTILLLLGISLSLGWWRRQRQQSEAEFLSISQPVEQRIGQALEQKELNPLKSRALLQEARDLATSGLTQLDEKHRYYTQLQALVERIDQLYQDVAGEVSLQPDLFLDLSFIEPGLFGEKLGVFETRLVVIDTQMDRVVTIGSQTKDPSGLVSGSELAGSYLASGTVNGYFVLSKQGVIKVEDDQLETVISPDPDWQSVVGFSGFGGNLYVLDSVQNEIWRYRSIAENEFSRERWLSPGVTPDFSQVVDMEIDGDIWVLDKDGTVRQYSRGVGTTISLVGIEENLQARSLGVSENSLFIFDNSQNRVYQFDKNGQYQKQFVWGDIGLVTDMVVIEDKIYLLAGTKIYEIDSTDQ